MSYQEQFQNHNKHDICQVRIGNWVKIGSLPCQGYYTSPLPIWFIFSWSMLILSHALGFSTFRKTLQKHIVERLLFASTRCYGGCFLKRPAGCFCPEYAELLFFPAAGAWGGWIGRYVHPVHGSSLVCPLFNPSPWYTSPWYARPPRLFLLCLLHWLFRYLRCPILLGSEPEKYQVPCFREATSINCNSVDLFSPMDFSHYLLPYLHLQPPFFSYTDTSSSTKSTKVSKSSQITTSYQDLRKYTLGQ